MTIYKIFNVPCMLMSPVRIARTGTQQYIPHYNTHTIPHRLS